MDWEHLYADEDRILAKHYTEGRGGHKIDKVVLHHNGGNLSIAGCYSVWQTREASAHYQVQSDGRVGQLVWDRNTAWHCGNWNQNQRSIGIEHADCSSSPWRISDAAVESGAHLVAAVCKRYGLGRPTWGRNVFGHSDFAATVCPASLAKGGSQHDAYMRRAGEWYDAMTRPPSAGWVIDPNDSSRWWYRHADGSCTKDGWEKIVGEWYLFDGDGWMRTGWAEVGGKWYYLHEAHDGRYGAMDTGWVQVGGKWYFLTESGAMATGWVQKDGKWYWLDPDSGAMHESDAQYIGGKWYAFGANGEMQYHVDADQSGALRL